MTEISPWHAVRTQQELHHLWRELMGSPGFASPSLWFLILEPDGLPGRQMIQVEDVPDLPDPRGLRGLAEMLRQVLAVSGEGATVAFCRSRPGRSRVTRADRAWAQGLLDETDAAGVPTWPVHLATDESLVVIAPDDLAGEAPA